MTDKIPDGITREHLLQAIRDLDAGAEHKFGKSRDYDVLHDDRRYPPKAVVGLAAGRILGAPLGPYDFKGGLGTRCFQVLDANRFTVVTKPDICPFPDELDSREPSVEGATKSIQVNRYERDRKARARCIGYHGCSCKVCGLEFVAVYGPVGDGFMHVHHIKPLSTIRRSYTVDPVEDLVPVCPNCHAMLHKRTPPFEVEQLRRIVQKR